MAIKKVKAIKFKCTSNCGNEIELFIPYCDGKVHRGKPVYMNPVKIKYVAEDAGEEKPRAIRKDHLKKIMKQEKEMAIRISRRFDRQWMREKERIRNGS